jgi:hypothetical protein
MATSVTTSITADGNYTLTPIFGVTCAALGLSPCENFELGGSTCPLGSTCTEVSNNIFCCQPSCPGENQFIECITPGGDITGDTRVYTGMLNQDGSCGTKIIKTTSCLRCPSSGTQVPNSTCVNGQVEVYTGNTTVINGVPVCGTTLVDCPRPTQAITLTLSTGSITLQESSSAQFTATVSRENFAGLVDFTVASTPPLPDGVISFVSNPISNSSSNVTFTAGNLVSPNTYTVNIIAASRDNPQVSETKSIQVTVTTKPASQSSPPTFTATVQASPTVQGSVAVQINNGTRTPLAQSATVQYTIDDTINLYAQAANGFKFKEWRVNNIVLATNSSPAFTASANSLFTSTSSITLTAVFEEIPADPTCTCYFVAPMVEGESFEVSYLKCTTTSDGRLVTQRVTETFTTFRNICSADIPTRGRNAQVAQSLGTDCTTNPSVCIVTEPPPTDTPSTPPDDTVTPTPTVTTATPTPTPIVASPTPTPTASWRSCIDLQLKPGDPPADYIAVVYAPNSVCWEPPSQIGFIPALNDLLRYTWQRGTTVYPEARTFEVTNPSYASSYNLTFRTNPDVVLSTSRNTSKQGLLTFTIAPRATVRVTVTVPSTLLNTLADGTSVLDLQIEVRE